MSSASSVPATTGEKASAPVASATPPASAAVAAKTPAVLPAAAKTSAAATTSATTTATTTAKETSTSAKRAKPYENVAATQISGLTPAVRDACLRAMKLHSDQDSFDRFYLFCQAWHKGVSQGTALALALLYARLFKAFLNRHQQATTGEGENEAGTANATQETTTTTTTTTNATNGATKPVGPKPLPQTQSSSPPNKVVAPATVPSPTTSSPAKKAEVPPAKPCFSVDQTVDPKASVTGTSPAPKKTYSPSLTAAAKKKAPALTPAGVSSQDAKDMGKVMVQKNFESLSTNVELSPKVSATLYRVVGDLAAVHILLPKSSNNGGKGSKQQQQAMSTEDGMASSSAFLASSSSWTDWSVAAVCIAAHDFVVASLHQPKLRKAWKMALHGTNTAAQERDMFFIFCEKTTEWMAGRLVRAVEAYQDFLVVWSKSVRMGRTVSNPLTDGNSSNDNAAQQEDKEKGQYLNTAEIEWEPAVPLLGGKDKVKPGEDILAAKVSKVETIYESELRAREAVWNLAVFYGLFVQQKQQQRIPSRRQRLIANTAAVAFVLGLQRLAELEKQQQSKPGESQEKDKATTEKTGDVMDVDEVEKTTETGLEVLMDAANKECAFTRWACLDEAKIAQNLTMHEVYFAVLQLAKSTQTFSQSRMTDDEKQEMREAMEKKTPLDTSMLPNWLQQLHDRVGRNPANVLFTLPSFSTVLVDSFSRTLRSEKIKVEAAFYFDETTLVQNESQIELLCNYLDRPMPEDGVTDDRTTAVAGSVNKTGMIDQPDKLENTMAKRRKLNDQSCVLDGATPAVITEAMELTEWTVALLYLEQVKPTSRLRTFFNAAGAPKDNPNEDWSHVIVPILNSTLLRLSQEGLMGKTTRKAAVSVQTLKQGGEEGVGTVVLSSVGSGELTHDKALCRALVAFFYHALECILKHESKRLGGKKEHPKIILDQNFIRALLACCTMCVVKAVGTTQKLRPSPDIQSIRIYQALLVVDSNPFDFLKVSDFFLRSLSTDDISDRKKGRSPFLRILPRILKRDFLRAETNVVESLVWARDSKFGASLPDHLNDFIDERNKEGVASGLVWWPVKALHPSLSEEVSDYPISQPVNFPTAETEGYDEYKTVSHIVEEILKRSYQRMIALCLQLDIPAASPLVKHAWICFRYVMRTRVYLFFDRHMDHWILCCLYGVAKKLKVRPEVKFTRIVDAYIDARGPEMGDVTCQRIVRNVKIGVGGDLGSTWGNVIMLYNQVFVPIVKDHLFNSNSLEKARLALAGIKLD